MTSDSIYMISKILIINKQINKNNPNIKLLSSTWNIISFLYFLKKKREIECTSMNFGNKFCFSVSEGKAHFQKTYEKEIYS